MNRLVVELLLVYFYSYSSFGTSDMKKNFTYYCRFYNVVLSWVLLPTFAFMVFSDLYYHVQLSDMSFYGIILAFTMAWVSDVVDNMKNFILYKSNLKISYVKNNTESN